MKKSTNLVKEEIKYHQTKNLQKIAYRLVIQLQTVREEIPDSKIDQVAQTLASLFEQSGNGGFLQCAVAEELECLGQAKLLVNPPSPVGAFEILTGSEAAMDAPPMAQ